MVMGTLIYSVESSLDPQAAINRELHECETMATPIHLGSRVVDRKTQMCSV